MTVLLNIFLRSKYFNKINSFISKKIFKIFKIFFVETELKDLPAQNYKIIENEVLEEFKIGKNFEINNNKPYITYTHLLDLLSVIEKKEIFNFLDYGAGNLNLFFYLRKNIKNLNYFFFDQPEILKILKNYNETQNFEKLNICSNFKKEKLDLVYFGSSLQYLKKYKSEISQFKNSTNYLLISQAPFFRNKDIKNEFLIMKQINMHPKINYLYCFNYDYFIDFMEQNNLKLIDKNFNRVTKFLNFKNFDKQYKDIDMYDLFFKKI